MSQQDRPPAPPPPVPPSPTEGLPSLAPTIVITALLGVFGLIPAAIAASHAQARGASPSRYWKAFIVTFVVEVVALSAAVAVVVAVVAGGAQNQDDEDQARALGIGTCLTGSFTSSSFISEDELLAAQVTDCASPHEAQVLQYSTGDTADVSCDGSDFPIPQGIDMDRAGLALSTTRVGDLGVCLGSYGAAQHITGSFLDGSVTSDKDF